MGTYDGAYRLVRLDYEDIEGDEENTDRDPHDDVDFIEDVLGEFPNVWESMLTAMPRGGRKRERHLAMHAGGT